MLKVFKTNKVKPLVGNYEMTDS